MATLSSFPLLAVELLVELEKIATYLVKGPGASTANPEIAVVLCGLLHFSQTVAVHKVISALLALTHCEEAHCPVKVPVQFIVN